MNARDYARSIVEAESMAGKMCPPPSSLDFDDPGPVLRLEAPGRPPELAIAPARSVKVPPIQGMQDLSQRRRILHALANHELQAIELFAWALLAFPDTPAAFRRGLVAILAEEQLHCRLYIERLEAFGGSFGDQPVTGHFWHQLDLIQTPTDFICTMGLVFENANLDFAQDYAEAARKWKDEETAAVLDRVHDDEIRHVAFAWRWLQRWKQPDKSGWQAFVDTIQYPMSPSRARGKTMDRAARVQAGLDEEFIENLQQAVARRPNGKRR